MKEGRKEGRNEGRREKEEERRGERGGQGSFSNRNVSKVGRRDVNRTRFSEV